MFKEFWVTYLLISGTRPKPMLFHTLLTTSCQGIRLEVQDTCLMSHVRPEHTKVCWVSGCPSVSPTSFGGGRSRRKRRRASQEGIRRQGWLTHPRPHNCAQGGHATCARRLWLVQRFSGSPRDPQDRSCARLLPPSVALLSRSSGLNLKKYCLLRVKKKFHLSDKGDRG